MISQKERETLERTFWEVDPEHRPDAFSLPNIRNKLREAQLFELYFAPFKHLARGTVLELGGGQLWASCMLKRAYPEIDVTGTDIGVAAVWGAPFWERFFEVQLDRSVACTSYEIPVADASVDLVFAFQAAHHFGAHAATFIELARVLKPGGTALYLCEPVCSRLSYGLAMWRVNRVRDVVQEDYFIIRETIAQAAAAGLTTTLHHENGEHKSSVKHKLYYKARGILPFIRDHAPGAVTFEFRKAA